MSTNGNLTLCDCSDTGNGQITGSENANSSAIRVESGGSFTMEGGTITGNTVNDEEKACGGGVYVAGNGSFIMEGGKISGNKADCTGGDTYRKAYGGGVYVAAGGSFTMENGEISNNTVVDGNAYGGGVYVAGGSFTIENGTSVGISARGSGDGGGSDINGDGDAEDSGGEFTMTGGAITGNTADNNGGGVYVTGKSTFTMENGTITGNTAGSSGGGVYVGGYSTFTMQIGEISGNTAGKDGGGVRVHYSTFTMENGEISDNRAENTDGDACGGGVYVYGAGSFTMEGGSITGNTVSSASEDDGAYGGGVSVDSSGSFNLHGGEITGNTASGSESSNARPYGGGVYVASGGSFTMSGGEITGNRATYGGGVYVCNGGNITMSGGAPITVTDNTAGGVRSNVYLIFGASQEETDFDKINVEGGLASGSRIGVSLSIYDYNTRPFTKGGVAAQYQACFFADDTQYSIYAIDNELALGIPPHEHPVCGATCDDGSAHEDVTWTAWTPTTGATLTEGNYYLTGDIDANGDASQIKITGTVNLCLNGHTFTGSANFGVFRIGENGVLNICDCPEDESGLITEDGEHNPIFLHSGGVCNLYGGAIRSSITAVVISANNVSDGFEGGTENSTGGTFNLYGGTVESTDNSQGIYVYEDLTSASVNLYGGTVDGGYAVNAASGTVTLSGSPVLDGGKADIYLRDGDAKIAAGDSLSGTYTVGMATPGVFTGGNMANYQENFTSADDDYTVIAKDGALSLHQHSYKYIASGSTITESCACGHSATATISAPTSLTYDGTEKEAAVTWGTGWAGTKPGITYTKTDDENFSGNPTNVGTYKASITVGGATASVIFEIEPKGYDADSFTIDGIEVNYNYTGNPIQPDDVTVKDGDKELEKDKDYTLEYSNNINKGTATVTVTFKGNYSGSTTVNFDIVYNTTLPEGTGLGDIFTNYNDVSDNWSNSDSVTFTTQSGWTVSTQPGGTYGNSVTFNTEGERTETVYVKETSTGNIYETKITYKLDRTKPAVAITEAPGENAPWTKDDVTVAFTATDSHSDIDTVTVAGPGYETAQTITESDGKYTFEATANGIYTVTVKDEAGNTKTETITISNIDKTEPRLEITGGDESADSLTLTVTGTNDGSSGVTVTVKKDNGDAETISGNTYTITKPGAYTFTATTGAGKETKITQNVYSIDFNSDGGSGVARQLVVSGGTATQPVEPTRTGYTFDAWQNESTNWNFNSQVNSNLTLTAKWTLDKPTVTLSTNAENNTVTYGTPITITATVEHAAANVTCEYEWHKDDRQVPISGETGRTLTLTDVNDSDSYTVKVTATDSAGLTATNTATIRVTINRQSVNIPEADTTQFTYNGQTQTYEIDASELYTVSGNQQTNAGDHTITVALNDKANYQWGDGGTDDKTYTFTIAQKVITATWSGLTQVYDDNTTVQATLSGVVDGDIVAVSIAGGEQAADSYDLTATLTGDDAVNYSLKNNKEILTIRPKSVGFTVTDNAVEGDGTAKTATVTPIDGVLMQDMDYTVTYRQNGNPVTDPTAVGSYEIWVKITNDNYRHTNGKADMQVGTLTITQAPPVLYDVTFAGGVDVTGSTAGLEAVGNSVLTLPACGYSKDNYQFTGWLYNGKIYQPGDSFTTPSSDVIFTAQWQAVFAVTGTVMEKTDSGEQTTENAVVSLWLGANKLSEVITGENGTFEFANLIPGIYNLVVTKGERTVTSMVEITTEDKTCNAVLPQYITNSVVEVKEGSPDIVVGNLEKMFTEESSESANGNYDSDDVAVVEKGGKVEITFTAEDKTENADETTKNEVEAIKEQAGASVTLGLVMDYSVQKDVYNSDGEKDEDKSTAITQTSTLLEIRLPLPAELWDMASYAVYRYHGAAAEKMTENPGENQEGFTVDTTSHVITIYAQKFSTYAIGYTEYTGGGSGGSSTPAYPPSIVQPEHGTVTVSPKNPQKGDGVTIIPSPEARCVVDEVTVTDAGGKPVEVAPNDDGTFTFVQPNGKVAITVTFQKDAGVSNCPQDNTCPMAAFADADRNAWYHDGVHYCVENGLMEGTGSDTFAPDDTTTRGMIVTILWRLEGSPIVDDPIDYDDVTAENWYGEAVRWADSASVVTGYGNGRFGPNDPITREQMAAMLWRYAGSPEADGSLSSFADGEQTSSWAQSAMIWAVDQGLITGIGNDRLDPGGQATRAQVATILMRFAQDRAQSLF